MGLMTYDFARDVLQYSGLRLNPGTPQPVIMQGVPFNIRALPWDPIAYDYVGQLGTSFNILV